MNRLPGKNKKTKKKKNKKKKQTNNEISKCLLQCMISALRFNEIETIRGEGVDESLTCVTANKCTKFAVPFL